MDFTDNINMPLLWSGETQIPVTAISVSNPGKGIISLFKESWRGKVKSGSGQH